MPRVGAGRVGVGGASRKRSRVFLYLRRNTGESGRAAACAMDPAMAAAPASGGDHRALPASAHGERMGVHHPSDDGPRAVWIAAAPEPRGCTGERAVVRKSPLCWLDEEFCRMRDQLVGALGTWLCACDPGVTRSSAAAPAMSSRTAGAGSGRPGGRSALGGALPQVVVIQAKFFPEPPADGSHIPGILLSLFKRPPHVRRCNQRGRWGCFA
jgi:hypothetical protein